MASTSSSASPSKMQANVPDKDEELQLFIQRFVSDTQSMINHFSEMFIGELRRFADICLDFSLSYRSVQEERQFLTIENKSLKDELDGRTAEIDLLSKELREIREENEELIRKLESFGNVNSNGEISLIMANGMKHYAVVNSMPAFPRRYSEVNSVSTYDHNQNRDQSRDFVLTPDRLINNNDHFLSNSSVPGGKITRTTPILLTPPVDFKSNTSSLSSELNPSSIDRRSHSRDDISIYANLLNDLTKNVMKDSDNQFKTEFSSLKNSPHQNHRTPSLGEIHPSSVQKNNKSKTDISPINQLSSAISSSAGTFYDCSSLSNFNVDETVQMMMMNSANNRHQQLVNVTDQIKQFFVSSMATTTANTTAVETTPKTIIVNGIEETGKSSNENLNNFFISKTPSPISSNFVNHFNAYRSYHLDPKVAKSNKMNDSDNSLTKLSDSVEDEKFFENSQPIKRYNSKKIQKKRKGKRASRMNNSNNAEKEENNLLKIVDNSSKTGSNVSFSLNHQNETYDNSCDMIDLISIIQSPHLDLNRYLLVEVCHFISPSHFYLIINDEKIGTNAFEDFLERFQAFYKSLEETNPPNIVLNNHVEENLEDEEERELRRFFSVPPPCQALTNGSFWACYIDDELDWRRIQIVGPHKEDQIENDETLFVVKDVDSGYSSLASSQMIRPLTDELASVPAFAVRASLAFIYPRKKPGCSEVNNKQTNEITNEYYDQWPLECCQLFEDMTYDQILTASILEVQREDLTDTEVAQVLLWCTETDRHSEVFINRKLIEMNFAHNVAEDDKWLEQFSEVPLDEIPSKPLPQQNEIIADSNSTTVSSTISNDQQDSTDNSQRATGSKTIKPTTIKTRSKKKKGCYQLFDDTAHSNTVTSSSKPPLSPSSLALSQNNIMGSSSQEPNLLLQQSPEPKVQSGLVESSPLSPPPLPTVTNIPTILTDQEKSFDQQCLALRHDPRLSNWIIQKHSRHVTLKKLDKICYLFRVTCFFEPNKFIGVLPFGERKLDFDMIGMLAQKFLSHQFAGKFESALQSPLRQLILDMTEYYQKQNNEKLKILPEQFIFEQANNSTIAFYESSSGFYLRGHIVGKDMISNIYQNQFSLMSLDGLDKSKSAKDLQTILSYSPTASSFDLLSPTKSNRKSLSLKRRSVHDFNNKLIIYGIDVGRYFLVMMDHLYHLEDRFHLAKPFAIVCKLHNSQSLTSERSNQQLLALIEKSFLGLKFIDIDFSTERFSVDLFTFTSSSSSIDQQPSSSSSSNIKMIAQNILEQIQHLQ